MNNQHGLFFFNSEKKSNDTCLIVTIAYLVIFEGFYFNVDQNIWFKKVMCQNVTILKTEGLSPNRLYMPFTIMTRKGT